MNYLLDTNVLSEATRAQPDPRVAGWLAARPALALFISVVSVAEIRKGILLLPEGRKKRKLEGWLESDLLPAFVGRVLPLGEEEMREWATVQADAEKSGHRPPVVDSLIAATARCHGLTIATRNIDDFRHCKIPFLNPWAEEKR